MAAETDNEKKAYDEIFKKELSEQPFEKAGKTEIAVLSSKSYFMHKEWEFQNYVKNGMEKNEKEYKMYSEVASAERPGIIMKKGPLKYSIYYSKPTDTVYTHHLDGEEVVPFRVLFEYKKLPEGAGLEAMEENVYKAIAAKYKIIFST